MCYKFQRPLQLGIGIVVGLLVWRTWLMLGLVTPIQVSGDSMAETLLGPHHSVTCAVCQHSYPVGVERMRADGVAVCPRCGQSSAADFDTSISTGESLLIDRTAYQFRQPRRWEVVVFRCPERAGDLCVKRVVGLPGESVQILGGDIYVDGQICRKELNQQRAVRQLVHKTSDVDFPSRWTAQSPTAQSAIDWLAYRHIYDQPIRDDAAYNQNVTRRLNDVADVMLSCRVQIEDPRADESGRLLLLATDFREQFEVQIVPARNQICLRRNEHIVWSGRLDGGLFARPTRLELSLFDRQLLLAIDGRTILVYPYQSSDRPYRPTSRPLAIGSENLALSVDQLSVWRDVFYGPLSGGGTRHGLAKPCQLGPDEFFLLGDNSPISVDSRLWKQPGLAAKLLVGKPLGVR